MTTAIQTTQTICFLQKILFEPYAEGAERINRAIEGVNLHHIQYPKIDLTTRVWSFLSGIALMIPLINSVIWICMKTLGNPEKLSEPFDLEVMPPEEVSAELVVDSMENLCISPIVSEREPLSVRTVKYKDVADGKHLNAEWTFKTYDDEYQVNRTDGIHQSGTSFDLNWRQKTYFYTSPKATVWVERKGNSLSAKGVKDGERIEKELEIPNPDYPWIQQPTTGFRPFVLSSEKELLFYGIDPRNYDLRRTKAIKTKEVVEPHGETIKLTLKLNDGWESTFGGITIAECWYDPTTGDLVKQQYRISFLNYVFAEGSSDIVKGD